MAKFLSGRNKNIDVGIESSTENVTVLSVIGNSNLTGDLNVTGVVTATSFSGSGSELTGINPTIGINSGGTNVGTAKTINFGTNLGATISNEVATVTISIPLSALTDVNTSNLSGITTDYLMVYDPTTSGFKFVNPKTYFGINNDANPAPDIVDYGVY